MAGAQSASAIGGKVVGWGAPDYGAINVPANATNIVRLAAGPVHTLALTDGGNLMAWGAGDVVPPSGVSDLISIAAGGYHSIGIRADESLWLWSPQPPVMNSIPPGLNNLVKVAAGSSHVLALRADGRLFAWGEYSPGQALTNTPSQATNLVDVAAGGANVALRSDGAVLVWESAGTFTIPLSNIVAVESVAKTCLALRSDGRVFVGTNDSGLSNIVAIASGGGHWTAVRKDGTMVAMGVNYEGQGNVPPGLTNVSAVAGGGQHNLALYNVPGLQLRIPPRSQTVLAGESVLLSCTAVGTRPLQYTWSRNGEFLDQTDLPYLWVRNLQAGNQGEYRVTVTNITGAVTSAPAIINVLNSPPRVEVSTTNVVALRGTYVRIDATVRGTEPYDLQWQKNSLPLAGQTNATFTLTNLTWADSATYQLVATNIFGTKISAPVQISPVQAAVWGTGSAAFESSTPKAATNLVALAAGGYHVLSLHNDGSILSWGDNSSGQTNVPPTATNVVAVAAGERFSVALPGNGRPVFWGTIEYAPTNVPASASNVIAIAAGTKHVLALRQDGTVVAWGDDADYRTSVPAPVRGIVGIAAGSHHSLALRYDGTVFGWGRTNSGESTVSAAATNIVNIAAGRNHNLALRANGTVLCWGDNTYGQSTVPFGASNIVAVAAKENSSMALRNDGTVFAWGDHANGRTNVPPLVTNVSAIAVGRVLNTALVDRGALTLYNVPGTRNSLAGEDLILMASAFGKLPLTYQWLFNGSAIQGATNAWLAQPDIQDAQAGNYAVIVTSGAMIQTGQVAAVTITPRAPIITQQPTNQITIPGTATAFSVSATGTTPLSYQWFFNGVNIPGATNRTLILAHPQMPDAGDYHVILSNYLGSVTSMVAHLELHPFNLWTTLTNAPGAWSADWGDYDNDGRIDLLVNGWDFARLFRNEGNGNFVDMNLSFGEWSMRALLWGDFNNDGFLDVLSSSSDTVSIFQNNGDGTFTNLPQVLTADDYANPSVVDFDRDGRLDISLGGKLYRNLGGNQFTNVNGGLPKTSNSTTAWGDYDGDGFPDVLISGLVSQNRYCRLHRNLGNGTFTNVSAGFPDGSGEGAWLDFDADGRLDVVLSGKFGSVGGGVRFSALYRNNGDGTFSNVTSGLPPMDQSQLTVGDADNDGQPDIFLGGSHGAGDAGRLFRGQTNGSFTQIASPFPTNLAPRAAWGDYDADGRLDLALRTIVANQVRIGIYRNDTTLINTPPNPPSANGAVAGANRISFHWGAGSDAQTPPLALTYGLRVGKTPGGSDVLVSDADTNGWRRLARVGNAGPCRSLTITNLAFGRYYWAVQSVDTSFAGSTFSAEQIFNYAAATLPATNVTSSEATLNGSFDTNRLPALAWFEWGLTTNHGNTTPVQSIPSNATSGSLNQAIAGLLPGVTYYYSLMVSNVDGLHYGGEQTFITTDLPQIVPLAATGITASNATLNALVNPNGAPTAAAFDYGLTRSYGVSTPFTNVGAGRNLLPVSRKISGLIGGQVYHFRVVATNEPGAVTTADLTFTTTSEPEATTLVVTNLSATSATLRAWVRPNTLPTDALFEYGTTTNLGSFSATTNLPATTNLYPVEILVGNLARLTNYYFRVVASNGAGLVRGATLSFSTTNDIIVLPPSAVAMSSATFNGLVHPNGLPTDVVFEYGLTTNFGSVTPVVGLSSGTALTPVGIPVTGLLSNRTCFVRVVATNSLETLFSTTLNFQTLPHFSPVNLGLSGVAGGAAAWGDYDNDGNLDLLMANPSFTRLFRNLGNGSFASVSTIMVGTTSGSLAWGDYNNDGWLDVLVVGTRFGTPISRIYRNNGNGTFNTLTDLPPVGVGVGRWGDFDNDGRMDVLLVGETNAVPFSKILRNNGNGSFTDLGATLPAYSDAHAVTLDYDKDGRLDVLLMGRVGIAFTNVQTKLYRNLGGGAFQDSGVALPGVRLGFGETGDFDGDGWPDLVYGGSNSNLASAVYLFRNTGSGSFSDLTSLVPSQFAPDALHWGDYDNDGRSDIFVRGQRTYPPVEPPNSSSAVLFNNGTNLMPFTQLALPEIWSSAGGVADYDNDGRLDLGITGDSRSGGIVRFYRNNWSVTNTPPLPPSQKTNLVSGNSVALSWTSGADAQSPSASLSYNLRVGRTPRGGEIISPLADTNGLRRVAAPGNVGQATSFILTNLPPGDYYWSVQSIDGAFTGSPFAPEQVATITGAPQAVTSPATNVTTVQAGLVGTVVANGRPTAGYFEWGTTTNYGQWTESVFLLANFATNRVVIPITNLAVGGIYHYRMVASNDLGIAYGQNRSFQTVFPPLLNPLVIGTNSVQLNFNASPSGPYWVQVSTNLVDWSIVGTASLIGPSQYRFVDAFTTNRPVRFYRVFRP